MRSANILLLFALAISIGQTMQMEGTSGSNIPLNPWMIQKKQLLSDELQMSGYGHLQINDHPHKENTVIITSEQDEKGVVGYGDMGNTINNILTKLNASRCWQGPRDGRKGYLKVGFRPPPLQETLSRKRKFNQV